MIKTNEFAGKQQYVAFATVLFPAKPNSVRFVAHVEPIKHVIECDVQRAGEHRHPQLLAIGSIKELQPVRGRAKAVLNLAHKKFTHIAHRLDSIILESLLGGIRTELTMLHLWPCESIKDFTMDTV